MSNVQNSIVPQSGIKGLIQNWKSDSISGFLVFLIALPLCLGISKASGFPPISGVFTAIIGGLVVTLIGGGQLTIKGPAAGLIVIALGAVEELGQGNAFNGYRLALAAIVLAGLIQVVFGLLKLGKFSDFFPTSAIHGMLAAIGIIIASKQIHFAIGVKPEGKDPLELLAEIPNSILNINPEIAVIGLLSLLILFLFPMIKNKTIKIIPAPLVVLIVAIPLGYLFDLDHAHDYVFNRHLYHITPEDYLVVLPANILAGVNLPDFSQVIGWVSLKYVVMFALVGSIESLLSAKAIDLLDPWKRSTNMNKDLAAVGIGNVLSGMIGGLPMISEIVRSSANINNGAKTRWSNFFHGFFLLLFVAMAASMIHHIPNAALAAMLIYTGYRLASPNEFYRTYKIGTDQLLIFLAVIITTLATDLLVGIFAGIITKFILQMIYGGPVSALFKAHVDIKQDNDTYLIKVRHSATFSNYLGFKKILTGIPKKKRIIMDFAETKLVDHTFMEHLSHFEEEYAHHGGHLEVRGLEYHSPVSRHPLAARRISKSKVARQKQALSGRQMYLADFADKNDFIFSPKQVKNALKMRQFEFSKGKKVLFEENMLIKYLPEYEVEIFDLHYEEGAGAARKDNRVTMCLVTELEIEIPDFVLEKEGFFDQLREISGFRDIDFQSHPDFSKFYLLSGMDEQFIRTLFDEKLIKFLETNRGYHVEAHKSRLLIYKDRELLNDIQIGELVVFVNELVAHIAKLNLVNQ